MSQTTTPVSRKNIVILGGSYAGVPTAHYLLKHAVPNLPDKETYQVILVSPSLQVLCRPACPRALISDDMFNQEKLFVNISKLFQQYPEDGFCFVQGAASELDHINRSVSIDYTEKIDFYALVIATGSSTPSLLGLKRDAEFLRASWTEFRKKLPKAKSSMHSSVKSEFNALRANSFKVIIAGGGPAGIETAGELGRYINGRAGWFTSKLTHPKVAVTVVISDTKILPALRPAIAKKAELYLAQVGVAVVKNARVKTVSPEGARTENVATKTTVTLENGETLQTDLYISAFGTRPNTGFIDKTLLTADGRVDTKTSTVCVDKAGPRIYAVGDVASAARPAIHLILDSIPILCANIKRDLLLDSGKDDGSVSGDLEHKEVIRETQLVPIGKGRGVGAAMGYSLPSFMVWLIKGGDYWLWTTGDLWSGKQWATAS